MVCFQPRGTAMSLFVGLFTFLAFVGLAGFMGIDWFFSRREEDSKQAKAQPQPDERRARLQERLDAEIERRTRRRRISTTNLAFAALLLSILFFSFHWLSPVFLSSKLVNTPPQTVNSTNQPGTNRPETSQPGAGEPGGIASLLSAAAVPWFGFASLLVIAGSSLILFAKNSKFAKGAGAVALAAGLTSHMYLIKDLKIDKIFAMENKIDLEADLKAYWNARGWSGVESYSPILPFVKGERFLSDPVTEANTGVPQGRDAYLANRFKTICQSVALHHRPPNLVMIVGTTDRSRLRGVVMRTFESNFGLARARAEWVRAKWEDWERQQGSQLPKECQMRDANFLTFGAGPLSTPSPRAPSSADPDSADDRQVDILAFWSEPKDAEAKSSAGFHLGGVEVNLGKKEGEKKKSSDK